VLGDKVVSTTATGQYLVVSVDLPITKPHDRCEAYARPYLSMGLDLEAGGRSRPFFWETAASDQSTAVASGMGVSKAPG